MIIKNNETKNRYWINNNEKYMNFDKYEKDNEDKNEYEKNQKKWRERIKWWWQRRWKYDYDENDWTFKLI